MYIYDSNVHWCPNSISQYVTLANHYIYHQRSPDFGTHFLGERSQNGGLEDRGRFRLWVYIPHTGNEGLRVTPLRLCGWPGPGEAQRCSGPVLCSGGRRQEASIDGHFKKRYHLFWLSRQFEKNNSNHNIPDQSCGWVYEFDFHVNSALYTQWVVIEIWIGHAALTTDFNTHLPGALASPGPHAGDTVSLMLVRGWEMEVVTWEQKNGGVFRLVVNLLFVFENFPPTRNIKIL